MSELVRFSVSLEADLLAAFDKFVEEGRFATRSEAIRQLLRKSLTTDAWEVDAQELTATLTLVYDHHKTGLVEKLLELQHRHAEKVTATLHVHLDHDHCLEVIVLKGQGSKLQQLASELRGLKGVHQGDLTVAGVSPHEAEHHDHHGHDDHGHTH
ncbi:MAG: nickel-responsive transcriptional regulator NikR [Bacteroidales bacterium]|nr:nickel-responsive transcriptional regulator NikR [Bacteroidales bacterium]